MSLDNILRKIQSNSQEEIEEIQKAADKEVSTLLSDAEKEAREIQKKINEKIEEERSKYLEKAISTLDTEAKNNLLENKQTLLSGFYERISEEINKIPRKDYEKFLLSLLDELPKKEGEIAASEKDENFISKAIKEKKLPYKISSSRVKSAGGFILKTKEIEIDNTIETLAGELKENTIVEINKIIFG